MSLDKNNIPQHIAIIMDGNRRWARQRGLPPVAGHAYVVEKRLEPLIEKCGELGIKYLTLWAFSTENWQREESEVLGIMNIFREAIKKKAKRFVERGAKLFVIGDLSRFPNDIQQGIRELMEISKNNEKVQVNLAINYGGRDEILRAVRKIIKDGVDEVDETKMSSYLDTKEIPDPDLIIRTGGEVRLSGFLSWQSAYSELLFAKTLMPDFGPKKLEEAIEEYQGRQRRFGK